MMSWSSERCQLAMGLDPVTDSTVSSTASSFRIETGREMGLNWSVVVPRTVLDSKDGVISSFKCR